MACGYRGQSYVLKGFQLFLLESDEHRHIHCHHLLFKHEVGIVNALPNTPASHVKSYPNSFSSLNLAIINGYRYGSLDIGGKTLRISQGRPQNKQEQTHA